MTFDLMFKGLEGYMLQFGNLKNPWALNSLRDRGNKH